MFTIAVKVYTILLSGHIQNGRTSSHRIEYSLFLTNHRHLCLSSSSDGQVGGKSDDEPTRREPVSRQRNTGRSELPF